MTEQNEPALAAHLVSNMDQQMMSLPPVLSGRKLQYQQNVGGGRQVVEGTIRMIQPQLQQFSTNRRLMSPRQLFAPIQNTQRQRASPLASPVGQSIYSTRQHLNQQANQQEFVEITKNNQIQTNRKNSNHPYAAYQSKEIPSSPLSPHFMASSLTPGPSAKGNEMNSDILVLMKNPKKRLDPLRLQKAMMNSSSSDSLDTLDSAYDGPKNFNYPPDLKTAQKMIRMGGGGGSMSGRGRLGAIIQVTDFNNQCGLESREEPRNQNQRHLNLSLPLMTNLQKQQTNHNSNFDSARKHSVSRFTSEPNHQGQLINGQDNQQISEEVMTVRNENLFSIMNSNVQRDQQQQKQQKQSAKVSLNKIMGNLQTFKDKQNRRDPSRRVNIPYYHRVISRNKYALSASETPPSQAIMFSKQIPLVERTKESMQHHYHKNSGHDLLKVQGDQFMSDDPIGQEAFHKNSHSKSQLETLPFRKSKMIAPTPMKMSKSRNISFGGRLSASMLPKPSDIFNRQTDSEIMLPQISITNKRLTQVSATLPTVQSSRLAQPAKIETRQFILKPSLNQPYGKKIDYDTGTDGYGTEGSVEELNATFKNNDFPAGNTKAGYKAPSTGVFKIKQDGQISIKPIREPRHVQQNQLSHHLPSNYQNTSISPTRLAPLQQIPKIDENGLQNYQDKKQVQYQNRFEREQKMLKANFNGDLFGVAEEKVKNFEMASVGSHSSVASLRNSQKVESILRSVVKKRSETKIDQGKDEQSPILRQNKNIEKKRSTTIQLQPVQLQGGVQASHPSLYKQNKLL